MDSKLKRLPMLRNPHLKYNNNKHWIPDSSSGVTSLLLLQLLVRVIQ